MTDTPPRLPRETDEPLPVTVSRKGVPTTEFKVQVTPLGGRATTGAWVDPLTLDDGTTAIRVSGYARGTWRVWGKPTVPGFAPVLDLGTFIIY